MFMARSVSCKRKAKLINRSYVMLFQVVRAPTDPPKYGKSSEEDADEVEEDGAIGCGGASGFAAR